MVLNPADLLKSAHALRTAPTAAIVEKEEEPLAVLLVDDSITTRTWEKRILEGAAYEVVTAMDGVDALEKLNSRSFDAVVTDVEMPRMDGLTLTGKIRQDKRYKDLPVILVTSLASDADKARGIEVGADAYITKSAFDQQVLLDTLKRLV
jgi:two-component system chemotaxis sensor kinase CheA